MVALCLLYASSAFAVESTWLVDGAVSTVAHEVDSESSGPIPLADAKGGIFGEEVEILCGGTDLGTIGAGKADRTESITVSSCVTDKGICPAPGAEPINLPWSTRIELISRIFYDDIIAAGGSGTVGYHVLCSKIVEDTCELDLARALLENNGLGVNVVFSSTDANQPKANCTRGGAEAGLVNGTDFVLSETGLTVAVSEA